MYELSAKEKNEHGKNSKFSSEGYLVDFLREIGKYSAVSRKPARAPLQKVL
jgi:hypothetical protein